MTSVVIDYGAGNIQSVVNALDELGEPVFLAVAPEDLAAASRIILPGVGALGTAMRRLNETGLAEVLNRKVRQEGIPFLGICLGMQMMCRLGHEGEKTICLGWVDAEVQSLAPALPEWRVPNIGWAEVLDRQGVPLFGGLRDNAAFYFCHSYFAEARGAVVAGRVTFGTEALPAVLWRGNAIGVQFHPERSGNVGLRFVENFLSWDGAGRDW